MEDLAEPLSELGGHQVVEDGVDGGVDVEHDAAKVEEEVEGLNVNHLKEVDGESHDPEGEDLEWEHARKKDGHHDHQHVDNLLSGAQNGGALSDNL